MPQISVIVNLRNGAATLREALDSALAQSFSDWELLVWDDCSTDDSAAIVAQYRDPRIRYLRSPDDTPLGKARQNAIAHARGEWLAFLDQDDIWLPRKLELQLALTAADVGMVYGRTVLFHAGDRNLRDYDYAHEFTPLPEGNIFPALFRDACFIAMSSALLRRTAVVECGGIPERRRDHSRSLSLRRHRRPPSRCARCSRWWRVIACTPATCRAATASGSTRKNCGCWSDGSSGSIRASMAIAA